MKPQNSPENEEVTPSKKKLKQARLPFKLLTEVSPKTDVTPTRKRKLSVPEPQPVTKVGKITKENNVSNDLVVISDDDSTDSSKTKQEGNKSKALNPYVKLVDTVWKKKQQKSKGKKKKLMVNNNDKVVENDTIQSSEKVNSGDDSSIEHMEVDETDETILNDTNVDVKTVEIIDNKEDIICLEEANGPTGNESKGKNDFESNNQSLIEDVVEEVNDNDSGSPEKESSKENVAKCSSPITPRRTPRNRASKNDKSLNNSQISDDNTNLNTPKRSPRNSTVASSEGDISLNESSNSITPKQMQKKLELAKKKEERDKKKQQEKEERARIKQEKEEQKKKEREEKEEAKRREKEEKEEQRRKEKEEKEKQKELEKKLREEKEDLKRKEKEEKEEQRRKEKEAREEERRKKQEALELEKQEQEQKKKKAAEAFVSFFVPKQKTERDQATLGLSKNDMLSNFTIKTDMRLAPTVRVALTEEKKEALDGFLKEQNIKDLYIKNIKSGVMKPHRSGKTWPMDEKDDDVMIIEDELPSIDGAGEVSECDPQIREKLRPKLLSFHENRRPPYWGTWRKKSIYINPRQPFKMDKKQLDYEVDSDEEWEEEEGESIDGSAAGSDNEEGPDEYEVDNEVFVPHGYLSDEEATMDDDDVLSLSPETQKAKLKHLEDEFETELKKPTEKLKPRLYGPLWETSEGGKPDHCVNALWNYFNKMAMIMNDPTPFMQPSPETEVADKKKVKKKKQPPATEAEQSPSSDKKKKKAEAKESSDKKKKSKPEVKDNKSKNEKQEKNQPAINAFLTKLKSS